MTIDPDPPFDRPAFGRLAASHIGQFLLTRGLRWQDMLGVDRLDTLIVQVALSAGIAHLPRATVGIDAPEAQRRPVSVLAVSRSMGIAYETTRRRFVRLAGRGLLREADNGYVVCADPVICGAPDSLAVRDGVALAALFARMRSQGFRNLPVIAGGTLPVDGRVARAIVDFAARSLEGFSEQHGGMTAGSIWAMIIAINVRHLLDAAELPPGFAEDREPLADHLRRPAPVGQIAEEVRLPESTVRRHVVTMVRRDTAQYVGRGVIVPTRALVTPQQLARSRFNIAHLRRLLDDVARLR